MRVFSFVLGAGMCALAGAVDSETWQRYASKGGGFSIDFPAKPVVTNKMRSFFGKVVPQTQAMYDVKTHGMFVKDWNLAGAYNFAGRERRFLDDSVQAYDWQGATVSKPTSFNWQDTPGSYLKVVKNKMEMRVYMLVHKSHFVELVICGMEGKLDMKAGKRFVESLRLF